MINSKRRSKSDKTYTRTLRGVGEVFLTKESHKWDLHQCWATNGRTYLEFKSSDR